LVVTCKLHLEPKYPYWPLQFWYREPRQMVLLTAKLVLIGSILVSCSGHREDRTSEWVTRKIIWSVSFPHLPIRVQAISRTTKAHSIHSWRLTVHTHRVSLPEILHPPSQGPVFQSTVRSQGLRLELHTVSKTKEVMISFAVTSGLTLFSLSQGIQHPGAGRGHISTNFTFITESLWNFSVT
jgi:hypothetical protein